MGIEDIRVKTSFQVEKPTIASIWEYVEYLDHAYRPHGVKIISVDIYNGDHYDGYRVAITVDKRNGSTREDDISNS